MNPRRWRLTKTIDVEIYGQRYSITGEADESYVKKLAELVDSVKTLMRHGLPGVVVGALLVPLLGLHHAGRPRRRR